MKIYTHCGFQLILKCAIAALSRSSIFDKAFDIECHVSVIIRKGWNVNSSLFHPKQKKRSNVCADRKANQMELSDDIHGLKADINVVISRHISIKG